MASKYEEKQGSAFSEFQGVAEQADTLVVERQAESLKL
jgi:hypothetical protein